jgi:hypothetical protein
MIYPNMANSVRPIRRRTFWFTQFSFRAVGLSGESTNRSPRTSQ